MAAYRRVDDLQSPAGRLPVHWDQLQAQRSITSIESVYLTFTTIAESLLSPLKSTITITISTAFITTITTVSNVLQ